MAYLYFLCQTHGSDLSNVYGPGDMTDYLVHFVNHGDPNGVGADGRLLRWPRYRVRDRQQMTFLDGDLPLVVTSDMHRADAFKRLTELSLRFPL